MSTKDCFLGIDVGTGSARAALFDSSGKLLASATKDTKTWRSPTDHRIFEQSTTDIWSAICHCSQEIMQQEGLSPEMVKGIGFDATCSLAVITSDGEPVCVTDGLNCGYQGERNIVLWADHRAESEADLINSTKSSVLDYVGGSMSVCKPSFVHLLLLRLIHIFDCKLEMEIPKIMWLKKHMPEENFLRCQFFDLPDFLTYRSTGSSQRSSCSLVCKCSYLPQSGWQAEFFGKIGLPELVQCHYRQIGEGEVLTAGKPVGNGLTATAAAELGLLKGTPVGSAVIDAYVTCS